MKKESLNIVELTNNDGCFDLQFRKDTRHERTGSPTYYRWKIQFIITSPKSETKTLEKIQKSFGCGLVTTTGNQARFSVQNIDELSEIIVSYFKKNALTGNKKKDFELWQKAVAIVAANKGKTITKWEKNSLTQLLHIHESMAKYKQKPKSAKWIDMAKTLVQPKI